MKAVWKYEIRVDSEVTVNMPGGAVVRHLQPLNDVKFAMWAEVDTTAPVVDRKFLIYGTGHPLDQTWPEGERGDYVGTVVGPALVWHLFDLAKKATAR